MKEISIGLWFGMLPATLFFLAIGELFLAGCFSALFVTGAVIWCAVLFAESFAATRRAARRLSNHREEYRL